MYNTPVCFLGATQDRASVVIAPGPTIPNYNRLLAQNRSAPNSGAIILSHLTIDGSGANPNPGVYGQDVVLEDVTVKGCRTARTGTGVGDIDGGALHVASIMARNCTFSENFAQRYGGGVYTAGGLATFQQVTARGQTVGGCSYGVSGLPACPASISRPPC